MMRDLGYDFRWYDKYAENICAKGFEASINQHYELLTAYELLEHLQNPLDEILRMKELSSNLLVSTVPYDGQDVEHWWYLEPLSGQHISLFCKKTLEFLAHEIGYHLYNLCFGLYLMTNMEIDIRNIRFYTTNPIGISFSWFKWKKRRLYGLAGKDNEILKSGW